MDFISALNQRFFVAHIGDSVRVVEETTDVEGRPKLHYLSDSDFHRLYANQKINVGRGHLVSASVLWLQNENRREYKAIVFDPKCKASKEYYNTFRGFRVVGKEGDCKPFLDFIKEIICDGDETAYEYLLNYLADLIQNPGELPGVAVVLQGLEGTGKGTFVTQVGKLVADYFWHMTDGSRLTQRFNDSIAYKLVVYADESSFTKKEANFDKLKGLITERKIVIEKKYKSEHDADNFMRLFIASNESHVIQASLYDRRFFVLKVSDKHRNDSRYFSELIRHMDCGGREAFMHYLQNRDIQHVNLRRIPQTKALQQQKLQSLSSVEQWWHERLMQGLLPERAREWPHTVTTQDVFSDYGDFVKSRWEPNRSTQTEVGKFLIEASNGLIKKRRRSAGSSRQQVYDMPSLDELRKAYEAYLGFDCSWD